MSWTTATVDLRRQLSDGATDRHRYRKRLLGEINGTNKSFKTLEFRRISNFTTAAAPLGVYKNGVRLALVDIAADYPDSGEVELLAAPVDGDVLEASYYVQWFLDSELDDFLVKAMNWLGLGSTVANLEEGLRPAALKYAAAQGYMKLAVRFAEAMSETFRLEDAPSDKVKTPAEQFAKFADMFTKEAEKLRDDFYKRQGQSNAPLFAVVQGNTRHIP